MAEGIRLQGSMIDGRMVLRPAPETRSKEAGGNVTHLNIVTKESITAAKERAEDRRMLAILAEHGVEDGTPYARTLRMIHGRPVEKEKEAAGEWAVPKPAPGSDLDRAYKSLFGGDGKPPGVARAQEPEDTPGKLGDIYQHLYGRRRPAFG